MSFKMKQELNTDENLLETNISFENESGGIGITYYKGEETVYISASDELDEIVTFNMSVKELKNLIELIKLGVFSK